MIPRLHYFWLFACALVAWPVWWLGCRWRRGPGTGNSPLRVLVIPQTNRIGDMVCATPVLRAIKMRFPGCYVAVLVSRGKKAWQVFEHNPRVDEIIFYETPGFVRHIRRRRFHWSFALTNYPLPSIVALLGLVPNRVKTVISDRTLAERLTDCFNTHLVRYEHHTYLPRHYLRLLRAIGIVDPPEVQEVFPTREGDAKVAEFLNMQGCGPGAVLIGISVTAGNKIKEWGADRFAALADRLIEVCGATIVFIGAVRDEATIVKTQQLMEHGDESIAATGFLISELSSLLQRLNCFIGVDTGPVYMAHALGVPVVDIVGPVDPREQPPQDAKSILVLPPDIAPSSFALKSARPGVRHDEALKAITVDMVFAAAMQLLKHDR